MKCAYDVPAVLSVVWMLSFLTVLTLHFHRHRHVSQWIRRSAIVVVVTIIAFTPQIQRPSSVTINQTEVYFVVDTTGSMGALDYEGQGIAYGQDARAIDEGISGHNHDNAPDGQDLSHDILPQPGLTEEMSRQSATLARFNGVRADIYRLIEQFGNAYYSVGTTDSGGRQILPLTTDSHAVTSWVFYTGTEFTSGARGSSNEALYNALSTLLLDSQNRRPDAQRFVFIFTDGEQTESENTDSQDSTGRTHSQNQAEGRLEIVKGLITGGAVLHYGTSQGGLMPYHFVGEADAIPTEEHPSPYIVDPETGQEAVSHADFQTSQHIAKSIGLQCFDRNKGGDIHAIMSSILPDGQQVENDKPLMIYRDFLWPFVLVLAGLLTWELVEWGRHLVTLRRARVL